MALFRSWPLLPGMKKYTGTKPVLSMFPERMPDGTIRHWYWRPEGGNNWRFVSLDNAGQTIAEAPINDISAGGRNPLYFERNPSGGSEADANLWPLVFVADDKDRDGNDVGHWYGPWPYVNADRMPLDENLNPLMASAPNLTLLDQHEERFFTKKGPSRQQLRPAGAQGPTAMTRASDTAIKPDQWHLLPPAARSLARIFRVLIRMYTAFAARPQQPPVSANTITNIENVMRADLARVNFHIRARLIRFMGDVLSHIIAKGNIEIDEDLVFAQIENLAPQVLTPPQVKQLPTTEAAAWKKVYDFRDELTAWEQKIEQVGTAAEFVDKIVMK